MSGVPGGLLITVQELKSKVTSLRAQNKKGSLGCGGGLLLDVSERGTAVYFARYKDPSNGKWVKIRLGLYGKLSLAAARQNAAKLKVKAEAEFTKSRTEGRAASPEDQNEVETEAQEVAGGADDAPLMGPFMDEVLERKRVEGRTEARFLNLRGKRRKLTALDSLKISQVTPRVLMPIINGMQGESDYSKRDCIQFVNICLGFAANLGYIPFNPCRDLLKKGVSVIKKPPVKGYAWVPAEELRDKFFSKLIFASEDLKVLYLMLAMTLLRRGPACAMQWSWIDFEAGTITIPSEAMKMGRPFRLPLTAYTSYLLQRWFATQEAGGIKSPFVFPSKRTPLKPMNELLPSVTVKSTCHGEVTIHGLRKSGRTWLSEYGVEFDVCEMILAHEEEKKTVRAYQKNDYLPERRAALHAWNSWLFTQLPPDFAALLEGVEEYAAEEENRYEELLQSWRSLRSARNSA